MKEGSHSTYMNLNSLTLLLVVAVSVIVYYLIPKRFQPVLLLIVSIFYYISNGFGAFFFILATTVTTYLAGLALGRESDDGRRRRITALTLLFNFGILFMLKYTNFIILNLDAFLPGKLRTFEWMLPLGISFYTFQSMGYLLDVCWKRTEAETSLFRFALFVSFFPQIMQGPIGRYGKLKKTLFAPHSFDRERTEAAILKILWGFFKKMVLADNALYFVNAAFNDYERYPGLAVFSVLFYSIQLYGDFSGGIDVVTGIALLFGVELDANFRQPFFATSIADFWHRWHITLGTWMKDYVFYPISLSGWMGSFRKWCRKHLPKQTARALPVAIANILVFLVVGVWHGAAWKYIVYGLYNGIIIGFSELMAVSYKNAKTRLHINDKSRGWKVFMVLRTFLLVNISWFFDNAKTVPQAFAMMRNAVTHFTPSLLLTVPVGPGGSTSFTKYALIILAFACIVLFVVSLLKEKGVNITACILQRPFLVRIFVYLLLLIMLPALGQPPVQTGGFIYAQF